MKPVPQGVADFLPEREDADGFLQTPEGDVEGMGPFGLAEEAVQADLQEFQFFQEGGGLGLVGLALLEHQLMAEMPGMAEEGRGAEAMGGGQGPEGHAIDQGAVDLRGGRGDYIRYSGQTDGRGRNVSPWGYSLRLMAPHRRDAGATDRRGQQGRWAGGQNRAERWHGRRKGERGGYTER